MKKIATSEFRARCFTLVEEVRSSREPLLITKRGKPVAKLVPVGDPRRGIFGSLKGVIQIVGDITSPIEPPEAWEVLR